MLGAIIFAIALLAGMVSPIVIHDETAAKRRPLYALGWLGVSFAALIAAFVAGRLI